MGEMIDFRGQTLCIDCAKRVLGEDGDCTDVKRHLDPTICLNCGADSGDVPLPQLKQVPTCQPCIDFFRNRPFPGWVKAFFATVVILVIVSLVWNWRFFQGYFEIKAAWAAMAEGQAETAAADMSSAAKHLPEVKELSIMAELFRGIDCLKNNRCEEAETCFAHCTAMPPGFGVERLRQEAALGAAFDRKNYREFLRLAEEAEKQRPNEAMTIAQVASAHACLYAAHGNASERKAAEAKLAEAKKLNDKSLNSSDFEERIRHRLETREIIDRDEFLRRFPNGWKASEKAKT